MADLSYVAFADVENLSLDQRELFFYLVDCVGLGVSDAIDLADKAERILESAAGYAVRYVVENMTVAEVIEWFIDPADIVDELERTNGWRFVDDTYGNVWLVQ